MSNTRDFVIENGVLKEYTGKGGAVIIPEDVAVIGEFAFCGRKGLRSITIPDHVISIQRHAFDGCGKLNLIINGDLQKTSSAFADTTVHITIKHWSPCVTKLLQEALVEKIYIEDFSSLPAKYQITAVLSAIEDKKWDPKSGAGKVVLEYLEKNAAKLCKSAFDHPAILKLLCSFALIHAKDMDVFTAEAEKRKDAELKALLLNYQNKLGQDTVAKARAKKEKVKEAYEDALVERIATRDPSNGIEGMTFVITGKTAEFPPVWSGRSEIKLYLEKYGAKLGSSVTKKTDYLVTDDVNSGSEKNRKAAELGVQVISETDFNDMVGKRYKDAAHVIIPSWLKEIPGIAFYDCVNLAEVTIPNSIISIGSGAFKGHVKLTSVTIPDSVTSIGSGAFDGCSSLTSVTIPDSVTTIGSWAFRGCRRMTSVLLSENVLSIGDLAFYGCPNLTIHAPAGSYAERYAKKNKIPFVAE